MTIAIAPLPAAAAGLATWVKPDDQPPPIHWEKDWNATYHKNHDAWAEQLGDSGPGKRLLAWRTIHLLQAMIQRFPNERDKRRDAYWTIAQAWNALEMGERHEQALKQWLTATRGDDEARSRRHWTMQALLRDHHRLGFDEVDALLRSGKLKPADDLAQAALLSRAELATDRGRLPLARALLERWDDALGRAAAKADDPAKAGAGLSADRVKAGLRLWEAAGLPRQAMAFLEPRADEANGKTAKLIADRLQALRQMPSEQNRGQVPEDAALTRRWKRARTSGQASDWGRLLAAAARSDGQTARHDGLSRAAWFGIAAELRGHPDWLSRLAADDAPPAALTPDAPLAAVMRAYRARPWSPTVQQRVLTTGERLLRRGEAGLAMAMFRDVQRWSGDAERSQRATVGWQLCLASTGVVPPPAPASSPIAPSARGLTARAFRAMLEARAALETPTPRRIAPVTGIRLPAPMTRPHRANPRPSSACRDPGRAFGLPRRPPPARSSCKRTAYSSASTPARPVSFAGRTRSVRCRTP